MEKAPIGERREGSTLADLLRGRQPLAFPEIIKIFISVLEDLELAHSQGLLHGDIKPAKIARTNVGTYKLIDYGASKVGTPRYMSPEKVQGRSLDQRSDLYSLGAVLFEVVTGQPPFVGTVNREIMDAHVSQEPRAPSSLRADTPKELDKIILKALAKKPEERFQNARQFRDALAALLQKFVKPEAPRPAETPPEAKPAPTPKPEPAKRTTVAPVSVPAPPAPAQPKVRPVTEVAQPARVRRRSPALWLVPLGIIVIAGLGMTLFRGFGGGGRVPLVVGLTSEEGQRVLAQRGYKMVLGDEVDDTIEAGRIAVQSPAPSTGLRKGGEVLVRLSSGMVTVPVTSNLTVDEALRRLRLSGLEPGTIESQYSDQFMPGVVIQTNPKPGLRVKVHSKVTVTVAGGRATCPECGRTRERGARFCTNCGYKFEE
ncbi:MAG: PASTA domain-containing protein [candidate division WOR-3 bacterium]